MRVKRPELVLAAAVAISSPMVPGILSGAIDPTAALVRFLGALVVCWVLGALMTSVLQRYDESARRAEILRLIERGQRRPTASPPTTTAGVPGPAAGERTS